MMSFNQSLLISIMGLFVVLIALSVLAVMIILFSKCFEYLNKECGEQLVNSSEQEEELTEEQIGAIIISAICEDLCTDSNSIMVKSIKEI